MRSLFSLCADLDSVDVDDLTQKLTHFTSKIKERQKRKPKTPRQIAQGDSEVDECKSSAADISQLDDDDDVAVKATAFAESENQMKLARSSARRVRDVCDEGEVATGDRPGTPRSRATKGKDRAQIEKSNTKAADRQSRDVIRSSPAGTVRWVE